MTAPAPGDVYRIDGADTPQPPPPNRADVYRIDGTDTPVTPWSGEPGCAIDGSGARS